MPDHAEGGYRENGAEARPGGEKHRTRSAHKASKNGLGRIPVGRSPFDKLRANGALR